MRKTVAALFKKLEKLQKNNKLKQAFQTTREIIDLLKNAPPAPILIKTYTQHLRLALITRNTRDIHQTAEELLVIIDEHEIDDELCINAYFTTARVFLETNNYTDARELFDAVRQMTDKPKYLRSHLESTINIAFIDNKSLNKNSAAELLKNTLNLIEKHPDNEEFRDLQSLANDMLHEIQNPDTLNRYPDQDQTSLTERQLALKAEAYNELAQFDQTINLLQPVLQNHRPEPENKQKLDRSLALLLPYTSALSAAFEHQTANNIFDHFLPAFPDSVENETGAHFRLARAQYLYETDNYDSAIQIFQNAEKFFLNQKDYAAIIMTMLGKAQRLKTQCNDTAYLDLIRFIDDTIKNAELHYIKPYRDLLHAHWLYSLQQYDEASRLLPQPLQHFENNKKTRTLISAIALASRLDLKLKPSKKPQFLQHYHPDEFIKSRNMPALWDYYMITARHHENNNRINDALKAIEEIQKSILPINKHPAITLNTHLLRYKLIHNTTPNTNSESNPSNIPAPDELAELRKCAERNNLPQHRIGIILYNTRFHTKNNEIPPLDKAYIKSELDALTPERRAVIKQIYPQITPL